LSIAICQVLLHDYNKYTTFVFSLTFEYKGQGFYKLPLIKFNYTCSFVCYPVFSFMIKTNIQVNIFSILTYIINTRNSKVKVKSLFL